MRLFSKAKTVQRTAAPKRVRKAPRGVSYVALVNAIEAVRAEITSDCRTARVLQQLVNSLPDNPGPGDGVTFEGAPPVTAAELDEVISDARDLKLSASTLRVLERTRAVIASAEEAAANTATEPPRYVSLRELEDVFTALGLFVGCAAEELSKAHFQKGELIRHLRQTAGRASQRVRPYLRRLVDAVTEYREPPREPESYQDRFARAALGVPRPRYE